MLKKILLLVMPAALIGLGFAARATTAKAWTAFTKYETPFAFKESEPASRPARALTPQVVMVLVDGLREDVSRDMPFLNELRQKGADLDCRVGLPSLSLPGRGVLFSGAWHERHGQITNFSPRPLAIDHVFASAKRAGLVTALAAGKEPLELFGPVDASIIYEPSMPGADMAHLEKELEGMVERSRQLLAEKRPHFFNIDLTIMDQSGHAWGGASDRYLTNAKLVDRELRKLVGGMDLSKSVLIVTADHGHRDEGGHGGAEERVLRTPWVMVGQGIKPGSKASGLQIDVAPTVAALLGIELPSMAQGHVMTDVLQLDASGRAEVLRALRAQRERSTALYVTRVSGEASASEPPSSRTSDEARIAALDQRAEQAKQARMVTEMGHRLGYSLFVVLVPLAAAALMLVLRAVSARELAVAASSAVGALALYFACFPLFKLGYSFSAINKDTYLTPFFMKNMGVAVGSCALACLSAGWRLKRARPESTFAELARLSWWVTGAFCFLYVVQIAAIYWRVGILLRWYIPDLFWGFGFYLDTLAVMAVGFFSVGMPLLAWAGGKLAGVRAKEPAPSLAGA